MHGLFVEAHDVNGLAAAIARLDDDRALLKRMAQRDAIGCWRATGRAPGSDFRRLYSAAPKARADHVRRRRNCHPDLLRLMCRRASLPWLTPSPIAVPTMRAFSRQLRGMGVPLGLAHRRLSIIDLSTGHQPLGNEDGSIQIVFNGEVYNFQELRDDTEAQGSPVRYAFRYRDHRPRLRRMGRRLRVALSRHVRLRHLGRGTGDAVPGARPVRQEAAVPLRNQAIRC